jgi:NAD(P)-dependent dehydrogenase (short-subunit alcohol dehydrogenase family)
MSGRFKDKSVLITGGAAGLGLSIARAFNDEGAFVTILDRSEASLAAAQIALPSAQFVMGDVTRYADNTSAVAKAVSAFGGLDAFIGNAGIFDRNASLRDLPEDRVSGAIDELLGINVKGYILGARAALEQLAIRRGTIIFSASVSSFHPAFGGTLYVTAKHAVAGLTKRLAVELAPQIRVNAVAPGYISTKLGGLSALDHAVPDDVPAGPPPGNFLLGFKPEPEDYSGIYTFLASDAARMITGTTILADGGSSIKPSS